MKYKIVTILGARPQFVKAAVLSRIISNEQEIDEIIIHTGQHYDANMSAVFFREMQIPDPKYNLEINGLGHGAMTGQMLEKIEEILHNEKPNLVLVYGDTNSTIAGALAAKKLNIPLVHVEAGLRSFNMKMPEEINRILTDRMSDLLLCPTDTALENLAREGFKNFTAKVMKVGDIMKDAVLYYSQFLKQKAKVFDSLHLESGPFILATIHRQENTDNPKRLAEIFEGLSRLHKTYPVIMPLHPRTKHILEQSGIQYPIRFIEPVGYFDMLALLKNCAMVVTDSGGLQKEAFFSKKPVIIARDETEWTELVTHGFGFIVGANKKKMIQAFEKIEMTKDTMDFSIRLYGNKVGDKIYQEILGLLKDNDSVDN